MSRLDKLKEQHPELNITIIDLIGMLDPTNTYKYSEFLIKKLKTWYGDADIQYGIGIDLFGEENVETLNDFEIHCKAKRIEKNDISQHTDFRTLKIEVNKAKEIVRLKELEKQTKKLLEYGEWLVMIPLSYEAAKLYGANTKWCITEEKYWNNYVENYKIIYVINRSTDVKYAISRDKTDNKDLKAWLSDDSETSPLLLNIPQEIWSVVIPELQKEESIWDLLPDNNKIISHNLGSDNILDRVRNLLNSNSTGPLNLTEGYMGYISTDGRDVYRTYSTYGDDFEKYLREYMYTSDELPDLPDLP
jgi:hypothetical protein